MLVSAFVSNLLLMCDLKLQGDHGQEEKVEYSGPLLSQSHKVDELLQKNERHIRQVVRTSWFRRGNCVSESVCNLSSLFPSLLLDPLNMWEWLFDCVVTGRKVDK